MNISNLSPTQTPQAVDPSQPSARAASADPASSSSEPDTSPSTIVTLSHDGVAASASASASTSTNGSASASASASATHGTSQPSGAKSFAYGVLGIGTPKNDEDSKKETKDQQQTDSYYSAGRIATAGVTAGMLLATLI